MAEPRYYVGSLSGYTGSRFGVIWLVFDRAYCCRTVREFRPHTSRPAALREQLAHALAVELNRKDPLPMAAAPGRRLARSSGEVNGQPAPSYLEVQQ